MAEYWGSGNLGGGGGADPTKSIIIITAPTGSTVTVSYNGKTKTAREKNGTWTFTDIESGRGVVWTARAAKGAEVAEQPIPVEKPNFYYIELTYWNGELYDSGNQFESVTGGWVEASTITGQWKPGTITFGPSDIELSAGQFQAVYYATKKPIDLSGYESVTMIIDPRKEAQSQTRRLLLASTIGEAWDPGAMAKGNVPHQVAQVIVGETEVVSELTLKIPSEGVEQPLHVGFILGAKGGKMTIRSIKLNKKR